MTGTPAPDDRATGAGYEYTPPPPTQPPPPPPGWPGAPWPGAQPGQPGYPPGYGWAPGYGQPPAPYGGYGYGGYYGQGYGTPYPGAPVPGYRPPVTRLRPGTVTAAAVLAFVGSGMLLLAAVLLFAFGSLQYSVDSLSTSTPSGFAGVSTSYNATAVLNLLGVALGVPAGVLLLGRRPLGRPLLAVFGGLLVGLSIYWLVHQPELVVWSVLFTALAVVANALLLDRGARDWIAGRDAAAPGPNQRSGPGA